MKIKIDKVEKTDYQDNHGNPKFYVFDGNGQRHTTVDQRFQDKVGQVVDVDQETGTFKGKDWSKIEIVGIEVKTPEKEEKTPQEVWDKKDRWQAKMSAWKSASVIMEGSQEGVKTAKLAQVIYKSITDEKWKIKLPNGMAKKPNASDENLEQDVDEIMG